MNGAKIAVEEINANGGNIQIDFQEMDDEHDAEKAMNAYTQLKDDDAQVIVGCVTTSPCLAIAPTAYADRMFLLTPSASSPTVIQDRDNVYQLCFSDTSQGMISAQQIKEQNLATKVAVIYNNADAYSTGIYTAFKEEAENLGLELVSETTFTDETATDFSVQLGEAKSKGAELIFLPIYYTPASLILKQAAEMQFDVKFFGCDGLDGLLGIDNFDAALAEGVMLLTPFAADAKDELTTSFVAKYKEAYNGEIPSQFAADGYDCVYALYKACLQSEADIANLSASEMCDLMIETFSSEAFTVDGLTGEGMTWKTNGEVSKEPKVFVIQEGAYVPM
jgi:branched-chain amino acid transport system substrate-binding protein